MVWSLIQTSIAHSLTTSSSQLSAPHSGPPSDHSKDYGERRKRAQHNSVSALCTFGTLAMKLHFQSLVELKGGAPVVVLYGEPDVGKPPIANAATSVLGIDAYSFRGMRREFFCPSSLSNVTGPHV